MEDDGVIIPVEKRRKEERKNSLFLRPLCDHLGDRVNVDHKHRLLGAVLEFMPCPGRNDHDVVFAKRFRLAIDNGFDLSFKDDRRCFRGPLPGENCTIKNETLAPCLEP